MMFADVFGVHESHHSMTMGTSDAAGACSYESVASRQRAPQLQHVSQKTATSICNTFAPFAIENTMRHVYAWFYER